MTPVPLRQAEQEQTFGGKAAQLCLALRAGMPVPDGLALSTELVEAIHAGHGEAISGLERSCETIDWPVAVRSSGIGEDGAASSFAGQHDTLLNVVGTEQTLDAVRRVRDSGHTEAALSYRERMGLPLEPKIGVVIQKLVNPDFSGVLFTRNPINGTDERVVESAWGFGEVVVSGLVTPDHYRFDRAGQLLEANSGYKDLRLVMRADGGLDEQLVDSEQAEALCLGEQEIFRLNELAILCEQAYGGEQDIEWAFAGGELYLLQRRAITAIGGP